MKPSRSVSSPDECDYREARELMQRVLMRGGKMSAEQAASVTQGIEEHRLLREALASQPVVVDFLLPSGGFTLFPPLC